MFKDEVSDDPRKNCDSQILPGKNILDCKAKTLPSLVACRKFAHQQIRVKQENDESNLNERPAERYSFSSFDRGFQHILMIQAANCLSSK
jgi:hypothetical protein